MSPVSQVQAFYSNFIYLGVFLYLRCWKKEDGGDEGGVRDLAEASSFCPSAPLLRVLGPVRGPSRVDTRHAFGIAGG